MGKLLQDEIRILRLLACSCLLVAFMDDREIRHSPKGGTDKPREWKKRKRSSHIGLVREFSDGRFHYPDIPV